MDQTTYIGLSKVNFFWKPALNPIVHRISRKNSNLVVKHDLKSYLAKETSLKNYANTLPETEYDNVKEDRHKHKNFDWALKIKSKKLWSFDCSITIFETVNS